jgi:hypothetical protein
VTVRPRSIDYFYFRQKQVTNAVCAIGCLILAASPAWADVRVIHGPTPIPGGDARAAGDLTVVNDHLAFALAVQSPPPYGVPRGALVDLAPVKAGQIGHDTVVFADFIPNDWSAWPNRHQQVTVVRDTPQQAVVETVRDWGAVTVTTRYTLDADADRIHVETTMANGGATALTGLRSGMTLWPSAGYLFGVPGLEGNGPAKAALADRVVAYDADWAVALHAPYLDNTDNESRDLYQAHSLAPGETRRFDAWLQVTPSGDLAPIVADEIARRHLPFGTLSGTVTGSDGRPVAQPVVVIAQGGRAYGWTLGDAQGHYRIALPAGAYTAYASARGYSETVPAPVALAAGGVVSRDFAGLQPPGTLHVQVSRAGGGAPLDGRIAIAQGQKPLVEFLGRQVFFTDLDRRGQADLTLAPGGYSFTVSWGKDVLAAPRTVAATVVSGQAGTLAVPIDVRFDPAARGWYAADLHHHADQAEAVTPAPDLARSQLAAGLDLLFVSDHDSLANHAKLQAIADRRGMAFLPGIEISTSWAHFNAYPIRAGEHFGIDTSDTDVHAVFAEARRMGAEVVQVNHPFIPYGYLTSLHDGVAPGGWDPGFDLLEINSHVPADDAKVLKAAWTYWNAGQRYYLSAGTDVHDVWNDLSGRVRAFAHPNGPLSALRYARALKAGHGYVTYGPLVYPDHMFGDTLRVASGGPFTLGFALQAVAGLKRVSLISRGEVVRTVDLTGPETHVDFPLTAHGPTWYALIVEDAGGQRAYTDPIWIADGP